MKKLAIGLCLILVCSFALAEQEIIKTAENIVEVRTVYYTSPDENGTSVITRTEFYGEQRIADENATAQADLSAANALDAVAYKQEQIDRAQAKIDFLNSVQVEIKAETPE